MSEENVEVVAEVEATEKPAKAPKQPKVEEALYCTSQANGEGTVHAQIQRFVFENPGATRSAVVKALSGSLDTKNAQSTERYVSAYVAGGLRRGFLSTNPADAVTEFPVKVRKTERKSEKVAAGELTKQGRALVEALEGVINGAGAARNTPVSVATLTEALGNKPLAHAARTLNKLEKDGFVVINKDEEGKISGVALTDKEVPPAPVEAEAEAPAAE